MRRVIAFASLLVSACQQPQASNLQSNSADSSKDGASVAHAGNGPFGIAIGTPLAELQLGEAKGDDPLERPVTPPSPHSAMEFYVIYGTAETGVCKIFGISKTNENDGSGFAVRGAIDDFAKALGTKYGEPTTNDLCGAGEVACESQFWMMSLSNHERNYGKEWTRANDAMRKAHIKRIDVIARALDINTSDFLVAFTGDNESACEKAAASASAQNL